LQTRSAFTAHRSPFGVHRSPFTVRRSPTPFAGVDTPTRRYAHTPTRRYADTPSRPDANTLPSTARTTSSTVTAFIHRKSNGHSRKKQGLHST
jgi:hypothetical protein